MPKITKATVTAAAKKRGITVTFNLSGSEFDSITFDPPAGCSFQGDHSALLNCDSGLADLEGATREDMYRAALEMLEELLVVTCESGCQDCEDRAESAE